MIVIGNKGSFLFKSADRSHLIPTKVWVKGTVKKKGYWTTVFINPEEEGKVSIDKKGKVWKVIKGEKVRQYKEGEESSSQKYTENKAKEGLEQAASVNDKIAMQHILDSEKLRFGENSAAYKRLQGIYNQLIRILDAGHVYRAGNEFFEINGKIIDLNQAEKTSEIMAEGAVVPSAGYSDTELQEKYQKYMKSSGILVSRALKTRYPKENHLSLEMSNGLRDYQMDGVNAALEKYKEGAKGFICADGTGAGKTRQQLALAYEKMIQGESVLICTEKIELAKQNFVEKDGKEMGLSDKVIVLQDPEEFLRDNGGVLPKGFIYVTAYNKLKEFKDINNPDSKAMLPIDQLIFDEAHNMKNIQGSQKAKFGVALMEAAKNVALYTASPMDKPEHIGYMQAALGIGVDLRKMLKDSNAEKQALNFSKFFDTITQDGFMVKREVPLNNVEFLAKEIQLTPEEQLDFDEKYNEFLDNLLALKTEPGTPPYMIMSATAQGLMKLRGYVEKQYKINRSIDILEQEIKAGRQVVLFASRVNEGVGTGEERKLVDGTLKEIERRLVEKGYDVGAMFGGKSKTQQMEDLDAFQRTTKEAAETGKRKIDILIATEQSGSTGFNMDDNKGDKPRTLIDLTPSFSANISIQKYGRINRMSTKSKSRIIQMVTNTPIDSWLFTKSAEKMRLLGAVVQGEAQTLFAKTQQSMNEFNLDEDLLKRLAVTSGISEEDATQLTAKLINKINKKNQPKIRRKKS